MMKASKLVLVLGLIGIAGGASAKPGFLFGLKDLSRASSMNKKSLAKSLQFPNCVDFSGGWEGVCTDQRGQDYKDEIKIEHEDCASITLDGVDISITGTTKLANTSFVSNDQIDFTAALDWNSNRSVLLMNVAGMYKNADQTWVIVSEETMRLVDDKLLTNRKQTASGMINGAPSSDTFVEECVYSKKAP